jgi:hypothetical protein
MKLTVLDQFGIKGSGYKYLIPVIGCILVTYQGFNFQGGQFTVTDPTPVLDIP